jgi:hypothetical protein
VGGEVKCCSLLFLWSKEAYTVNVQPMLSAIQAGMTVLLCWQFRVCEKV